MKIRLMQITHDLQIGGLQQVVVNLCKAINKERFEVSVLCLRDKGPFAAQIEQMGIPVFSLPKKPNGTDYFSFIKVARILKRERIQVIHTHNTQPLIDGTLAALLTGAKTVVHTDHARDFPDKKRYMFAEWVMSRFVVKMVGVSDHTCQNLIDYEGVCPHKVMTIPNGIDGSRFDIIINTVSKRRELGLRDSGPIIGVAVRLTKQKGITHLLKAMPEIVKFFPEISLVIAGEGPEEEELRRECLSLGVERHVYFVGARADIPELLKLFDLYVLPSLWEGLPIVLLEALAAGCPVVATDVGGVSAAIRNGDSGSLLEPANPQALATEITNLLENVERRESYRTSGRQLFFERFDAVNMARKYERLYLTEISERPLNR